MANLVPSVVLEGVAELIEQNGQDPVELFRRVGIPEAALLEPNVLIRPEHYADLLELAAVECSDRFFALKVGCLQRFDIMGNLWLMARQAETIGEEMQIISENLALHTDTMTSYISSDSTSGKLMSFEFKTPVNPQSRKVPLPWSHVQASELVLTLTCNEFRRSLGRDWMPDYVQFRHAAPANDKTPLYKVFGHRVFFNQDVNAIHLTDEDFSRPNVHSTESEASTEIHKKNTRTFQSTFGLGESFIGRVNRVIRLLVNDEGCTASDVARLVDLPERTLRYRLKTYNTSYQALYDKARLEIAQNYLINSELAVSAIAERLHFTDTPSFSSFFKRQTGQSPRNFVKILGDNQQ